MQKQEYLKQFSHYEIRLDRNLAYEIQKYIDSDNPDPIKAVMLLTQISILDKRKITKPVICIDCGKPIRIGQGNKPLVGESKHHKMFCKIDKDKVQKK